MVPDHKSDPVSPLTNGKVAITSSGNEGQAVSNSVFGLDNTITPDSKSRPRPEEQTEDEGEKQNVFKKYEKNEAFPIHATYDDSQVDKDSQKPGGFFTKHLYQDKAASKGSENPSSPPDIDRDPNEKSEDEDDDSDRGGIGVE